MPGGARLRDLEKAGVVRRRVALLGAGALNLGVTVFVGLKTGRHSRDWLEDCTARIAAIEEVVEFYRMSGDVDYLLKIVVPDIAGYDKVYKRLIKSAEFADVTSSFAMEEIKYTTALPLGYAGCGMQDGGESRRSA